MVFRKSGYSFREIISKPVKSAENFESQDNLQLFTCLLFFVYIATMQNRQNMKVRSKPYSQAEKIRTDTGYILNKHSVETRTLSGRETTHISR